MTSSLFLYDGLLYVIPPDRRLAPYFLRLVDGAIGHEEDNGHVVWSRRAPGGAWTTMEVTDGDWRLEAAHAAMRYAPGRPPVGGVVPLAESPGVLPVAIMSLDETTVEQIVDAAEPQI